VFAAGDAAIDAVQTTEDALYDAADVLDVTPEDVPETADRFFTEWKERGKTIDKLKSELAEARAQGVTADAVSIDGIDAVIKTVNGDADELRKTANAIVDEDAVAVLGSDVDGSAQFVVGVPEDIGINAGDVVGQLARKVGGGGGGPPDFAQGGGPDAASLEVALDDATSVLRSMHET